MSNTPITDANAFEVYAPDYNHHGERVVRVSVARKLEKQRNELLAALEVCFTTLTDKRLWHCNYMEGSQIYEDFNVAAKKASAALAAAKEANS